MTDSNKISASQLFCVMLLCSLGGELVYPFLGGYSTEELLAIVVAAAIRLAAAFPIILYSFCKGSLYGEMYRKSKPLGWVAAITAAVLLIVYASVALANTAEFVERNMLTHQSEWLIIALIAAFAVFCAVSGAEGISRAAVIILVLLVVLIAAVVLTDIPHIDLDRAAPPESSGGIWQSVIKRLLSGGEYLSFAVLLPYISRKSSAAGKAALFYALTYTLLGVGLYVFYSAVLGELYTLAEHPFIAAAQLADAMLIKRMDGIACAMGALAAAVKCGVLIFCAAAVFRQLKAQQEDTEVSL